MQGWQLEQRRAAVWEASGLCTHLQVPPARFGQLQMLTSNRTSEHVIAANRAKPALALSSLHRHSCDSQFGNNPTIS